MLISLHIEDDEIEQTCQYECEKNGQPQFFYEISYPNKAKKIDKCKLQNFLKYKINLSHGRIFDNFIFFNQAQIKKLFDKKCLCC